MRHISIKHLLRQIATVPSGTKALRKLRGAHIKIVRKKLKARTAYIERNGTRKWSLVKNELTAIAGNKCWYTEAELVGAPLTIDHYRPRESYWFLAFDADNYRVACPFANSPKHNTGHGCAGGKGKTFPLLGAAFRAAGKSKLKRELPLILDPCNPRDCDMVTFQADGRPILNPKFAADPIANQRLTQSLLLLNIDHPDFNSKREQLYHDIKHDVATYGELLEGSPLRTAIEQRMLSRLSARSAFSMAARSYVRFYKTENWIADILECTK